MPGAKGNKHPTLSTTSTAAVDQPSNDIRKTQSSMPEILGTSQDTYKGKARPSSGPATTTKSSKPLPYQSKRPHRSPVASAVVTDDLSSTEASRKHSQGFQQLRPGASTSTVKSNASMCSVSQHRGRTPLCGLLHRKDFEVRRICRKLLVDGKAVFVVRWKSTWVPAKLIVKGNDVTYPYVDADGTRWHIKRTFGHREKDGIQEVKARWVNTKEPIEMLSNAQDAIDIFEANLQTAGADESAKVRRRRVLTIQESHFPRGTVLPQGEEDYAESQRWVSSHWPEIRPHATLDLYPAIYRIHMELADAKREPRHRGKSYRCLMKLPQLRPLRWNEGFLNSEKSLTCCRRKRASLFIQATGAHVDRHCTRCSQHELTPFLECVRTAPGQQRWLNGACANCGTHRNVGCDFHEVYIGRTATRSRTNLHPEVASVHPDNTIFTKSNRDNDSIDSSDDDSDDDDDDDYDEGDDDGNGKENGYLFLGGKETEPQSDAPGSRLWPPFPVDVQAKDFVVDGVRAGVNSTSNQSQGPSISFGRLDPGSSPSIRSERRGKLPTVTRVKELLARRSQGHASHSSSPDSAPCTSRRQEGINYRSRQYTINGVSERSLNGSEGSRRQQTSSVYATNGQPSIDSNFTPQPIELDLLELSFKYDHLKPLNTRIPQNAASPSTSTAADGSRTLTNQMERYESLPERAPVPSPVPTSSSSKKRPASMPPLHHRRPSQRQAFTTNGDFTIPAHALPSSAPAFGSDSATVGLQRAIRSGSDKTYLQIRTTKKLGREAVHPGCEFGHPCRNYEGQAPIPRDPQAYVRGNALSEHRQISPE